MIEQTGSPTAGAEQPVTTKIELDEKLVAQARELAEVESDEEAVKLAVQEFVTRHNQMKIIELFGTMDPDPDYDYKKARYR